MLHLPLAAIDAQALPRDRTTLDPQALDALAASIAAEGLRQPIEVFELATPTGPLRYGLISGLRRLSAHQRLATRNPAFATIPAILRTPADLPAAMAAMVTENEIREPVSPWEKASLLLTSIEQGLFPTPDAAIASLFPHSPRQTRARLRAAIEVLSALDGTFTTPERLSAARIDALALALRLGFEEALAEALHPLRGKPLDAQWQAIAPLLAESRSPRGAPGLTPGRPRRTLTLRQGLTIRREMTRTGWLLRFSGPEARSGGLIDDVLDEVERMFQVR
jgi:ParB family chromosome partitioning protein